MSRSVRIPAVIFAAAGAMLAACTGTNTHGPTAAPATTNTVISRSRGSSALILLVPSTWAGAA